MLLQHAQRTEGIVVDAFSTIFFFFFLLSHVLRDHLHYLEVVCAQELPDSSHGKTILHVLFATRKETATCSRFFHDSCQTLLRESFQLRARALSA